MRISDWSSDVCSSDLAAMRREIASKLRRAASVLRTVMLWASLALWLAIAATALIVVLAVGLAAYFAFGWLGVGAVAVFVLIVFFGKDPPTEQTGPRRKGKGLNLNDEDRKSTRL